MAGHLFLGGTVSWIRFSLPCLVCGIALASPVLAKDLPGYLRDRGPGMATSMFGSYVEPGQLLVYPFYEYTVQKLEYKPSDIGYGLAQDFRGRYREGEDMFFLGYGVTPRLTLEFESALNTSASLNKAPADPSATPTQLRESGFGDTQTEARWRWRDESASRPEVFSYLEVDFPFQRHRRLIGTQDWEYKLGTAATKGFAFGTLTVRAAAGYHHDEGIVDLGEYGVEYLKRLSDRWRLYNGIEGTQDEVEFITEQQLRLSPRAYLKINNSFGLTPKAPQWAPEFGIMFSY
jgi:hypothetical protein